MYEITTTKIPLDMNFDKNVVTFLKKCEFEELKD